mmetsp:Transcript_104105/g.238381  ORF Transcript_104105/g.238381 Transcript_104105/m.238381 type:complete len:204 (-) Transcript_104105:602-1213(-)
MDGNTTDGTTLLLSSRRSAHTTQVQVQPAQLLGKAAVGPQTPPLLSQLAEALLQPLPRCHHHVGQGERHAPRGPLPTSHQNAAGGEGLHPGVHVGKMDRQVARRVVTDRDYLQLHCISACCLRDGNMLIRLQASDNHRDHPMLAQVLLHCSCVHPTKPAHEKPIGDLCDGGLGSARVRVTQQRGNPKRNSLHREEALLQRTST